MACPVMMVRCTRKPVPVASLIHLSLGLPRDFNGLIPLLHSVFLFPNGKILINDCLVSESDMALFTPKPNLCKKLVKAFAGPFIALVNYPPQSYLKLLKL